MKRNERITYHQEILNPEKDNILVLQFRYISHYFIPNLVEYQIYAFIHCDGEAQWTLAPSCDCKDTSSKLVLGITLLSCWKITKS